MYNVAYCMDFYQGETILSLLNRQQCSDLSQVYTCRIYVGLTKEKENTYVYEKNKRNT